MRNREAGKMLVNFSLALTAATVATGKPILAVDGRQMPTQWIRDSY